MSRFDRPGELGSHLERNAAAWNELLGDVDASSIEIFGRIDAVARHWAALQREVLTPFGINYAELTTLGILRTTRPQPRRSPTELRGLIGQTSAGMTRILDKLESEGFVRREAFAEDRRRVDIRLTRAGARLAETAFRKLIVRQNEASDELDEDSRKAMIRGLDRLLAAFIRPRT
ncbi:MAG: MarR family transcriptional regulator [Deltaproteobacteria bacterium]|jgi:DNA-binding MarR family transcriptional regulator|nr:MarR family transcriptional regulator [Deltaproteobacteria bacterium]MBW2500548.1 MarR family transcriptional regulator [Deltaproteobacteria bacterium]